MSGYQHTVVVGNVGRDPELRYMPSGDPVASFSLAVSRRWTNRDGQPQEKTTWFNVSVFGRQAETVHQYVTKGRQVLVEGEVEARAYTAQDGTPRASLDLRARDVRFLGTRGEEQPMEGAAAAGGGGGYRREQPPRGGGGGRPSPRPGDSFPDEAELDGGPAGEDEIPF
jgi:single-strand DNA-binding protein